MLLVVTSGCVHVLRFSESVVCLSPALVASVSSITLVACTHIDLFLLCVSLLGPKPLYKPLCKPLCKPLGTKAFV
jgi:hypothetical protein